MSSCSQNNPPNCNPCCVPRPVCDPSNEALESQLNNLITFLIGVLTKSCGPNNEVIWSLPCDLDGAEPIPGYPITPGQGFLCYLISVITVIIESIPSASNEIIDLVITNTNEVVIDWSLGSYFRFDGSLTEESTINFIHENYPAEPMAKTISVLLFGGTYSATWDEGKWAGSAPFSTKSLGDDVITFSSFGSNGVYGSAVTDMG